MPTDPIPCSQSAAGWCWDHSYVRLPELFYVRVKPVPVGTSRLVVLNRPLAVSLGLDTDVLGSSGCTGIFSGNGTPEGSDPIAQAYAGHQFGHFTGLGDGRAVLLGEQITPDGKRFDIQLKGSGRTPFSRGGDGRAALGPMLREYIISEAMHSLGIPTTRSLAVALTGEEVFRAEMLPGAVLTRVAASHIRVGTFQWAAAHQDTNALRALADHARQRHFPDLQDDDSRHLALFESVMDRQAALIAQWLHVGFIHGVMNTDNMTLSGETIDYGPCAFMDSYDPDSVFSSIDRHGRYAYGKQPEIAHWNLARLAEAMLPLFDENKGRAMELANDALEKFEGIFHAYWLAGMRKKLGLFSEEENDASLIREFLHWMFTGKKDFTNTFWSLSEVSAIAMPPFDDAEFGHWHLRWRERLARQPQSDSEVAEQMRSTNPTVIPRNHKVEEALAAAGQGDIDVMSRLLTVLGRPHDAHAPAEYTSPPSPGGPIYQTFCGT